MDGKDPVKPLRLLAVIEASTITGPAKNLLQFAALAREENPPVETELVVFRRPGDSDVLRQAADKASVPVHFLAETGRFDRRVIPELKALVQRLNPDIIQTHAVKSHLLIRMAGLHKERPWIAFHHGYTWQNLRVRLYNQLDRWSLPAATAVLTVSQPFREELVRQGVERGRIRVIHNAIDPQWGAGARKVESSAALRAQWRIPEGRKVILIVGRLSLEKDHATLVRAVAGVPGDPHLVIVGEGPERPRIEELVRSLQMQNRVTFTGQVASAEPYYGIADVSVLSSRTEGSPNALLEAMAAGVPVVATPVGGIPEIVTDRESALLVPPSDPGRMKGALQELLTDAGFREGLVERARRLVLENHSPRARAQYLCAIYRSFLEPSGSGRSEFEQTGFEKPVPVPPAPPLDPKD